MPEKYEVVPGDTLWGIAQRYFGDGGLYPALAIVNHLPNPNAIVIGQELLVPYITYRHHVAAGETKAAIASRYYGDPTKVWPFELANHVAQRDIHPGEWLLIPDLGNVEHHTVVTGETLPELADRWYGEARQWPLISRANQLPDDNVRPGQVLEQPRLNRRHIVQPGETLWALTQYEYGDNQLPMLVAFVAAANHIPDPDRIDVGQVIFFPPLS